MLAFLDSPIQLLVGAIIILVVFGPQKLPEIAGQLGRALRELKRTTTELQDSLSLDTNRYDDHYTPTNYDSYGNPAHYSEPQPASVPESDLAQEAIAPSSYPASEPLHGDFAASALSDAGADYGVGGSVSGTEQMSGTAPVAAAVATDATTTEATKKVTARPAKRNISREA